MGNHAIKGTEGAQVIAELKPDEAKDYIVEKRTYSGFAGQKCSCAG
jgi:nicotinamidase-related amidase